MDIIITDLTRLAKQDIVCIAGINPATNECVRPLPYLSTNECRRLNILPGAILHGNFTTPPITAPHTEDRNYQGKLSFKGPCTAESFISILKATESPNAEEGPHRTKTHTHQHYSKQIYHYSFGQSMGFKLLSQNVVGFYKFSTLQRYYT